VSPRRRRSSGPDLQGGEGSRGFLLDVTLEPDRVPAETRDAYPFSIPAVRGLSTLAFHPKVTFFVGENGSGKSTLIEALAVAAGFNAEGGSKAFNFTTRKSHSSLHDALVLARGHRREKDGFFLRAESFFNVATEIENVGEILDAYGGKSLHEQSHGESFLALANHRFRGNGLYILDEPEAALSPTRQLSLLKIIDNHVRKLGSQFLIATHSPILMAYPDATIYNLVASGIEAVEYEETEHYKVTRSFLEAPKLFFRHLFDDTEAPP
jgi:predicted ATPase